MGSVPCLGECATSQACSFPSVMVTFAWMRGQAPHGAVRHGGATAPTLNKMSARAIKGC